MTYSVVNNYIMNVLHYLTLKATVRSINAYDVSCVEKGPVFRIPVTVLQPQPLQLAAPAPPRIVENKVLFKPATIVRHFVIGE